MAFGVVFSGLDWGVFLGLGMHSGLCLFQSFLFATLRAPGLGVGALLFRNRRVVLVVDFHAVVPLPAPYSYSCITTVVERRPVPPQRIHRLVEA